MTNDYEPGSGDSKDYDAILLVSFGGPEGTEDVLPFLETPDFSAVGYGL